MTTKQLRNKILDLAIKGKLVEKEGEWEEKTGKEIFEPLKSTKPSGEYFNYIDIDAIDNKRCCVIEPKRVLVTKAPSRASRHTQRGDVLFSMVRPYLRNIALVEEDNCIASTGFYVCRSKLMIPKFCYYLMISEYVVQGLNAFMKGDNSPSINNKNILDFKFPLPPLAEQHRIVAAVEQWMSLVDIIESGQENLQQSIALAKNKILDLAIKGKLVPQNENDEPASVLLERIRAEKEQLVKAGKLKKKDLVTTPVSDEDKPFEVPEGWEWCRLGEIFMFIRNGKSIKQSKDASGIPITRIETISNCDINRERMGYANIFDVSGYEEYLLKNGDILMSHINSPIHVGKSALCKDLKENEKIIHGMNLLCLRAYSTLFPSYIEKYFNSNVFKELIRPYVQNAVNQASINTKVIGSTLIPLPPLVEQHRIVAKIEELFTQLDIIANALK